VSGKPEPPSPLLATLARRVTALRHRRGWSRRALSERSGVSVRYLARVEAGEGNLSLLRLEALAAALGTTPAALVQAESARGLILTLVGLRGAGKSTVGPLVAAAAGVPFIEMDTLILEASGLPLDQLFELGSQGYVHADQAAKRNRQCESLLSRAGAPTHGTGWWGGHRAVSSGAKPNGTNGLRQARSGSDPGADTHPSSAVCPPTSGRRLPCQPERVVRTARSR